MQAAAAGLAERLRQETRTHHEAVERAGIMSRLLRGDITRPGYCRLLRNLQHIYAALEDALARHAGDPLLRPIALPELPRERALAADLGFLHGAGWAADIAVAPAAARYAARLRAIAAADAGLLIAHSYVRYLGDLSGGQILRRIVAAKLGLEPGHGVAFYEFPVDDAKALAARYRAGLAAIPLDAAAAGRVVSEAQSAFVRHRELFEELAAGS